MVLPIAKDHKLNENRLVAVKVMKGGIQARATGFISKSERKPQAASRSCASECGKCLMMLGRITAFPILLWSLVQGITLKRLNITSKRKTFRKRGKRCIAYSGFS